MSIDNVEDLSPRKQYVASAAQTAFDYPFPVFEDADLVVDIDGTTKALSTDYAVTGAGDDLGGTVTLVTALTGGEIVTIYRDIPIERTSDFQEDGPLSSSTINDELDRLTLIDQQLEAKTQRAIRLPLTAPATDADLELDVSTYAGKLIGIDENGAPTPVALLSAGTTLTSSLIATTLDSLKRAAEEITAGITPANFAYAVFDPLRNGAVGDGATDDTTAWNAAIATAAVMGAVVRPSRAKTFLVDTIVHASNVTIDFNGATLKAKAHVTTHNPVIRMGTLGAAISRARICNGKIDGNASQQTFAAEEWSPGVFIWGSDYCAIDNMVITNCKGDGITIGYESGRVVGSNGNRVRECEVYSNLATRQGIAITYGNENNLLDNKVSGNIDLELNLGVGECKNNLVHGNKGRTMTENLTGPRTSDLVITLASLNTTSANYGGNIISKNHCKKIVQQYNDGSTIEGNIVVGSDASQTHLIDLAGGDTTIVRGNQLWINAAVATAITSALRTRGCTTLLVDGNICKGDTSSIPFHEYILGFSGASNASGHIFGINQTDSGYYRNGSYPMPSERARFKVEAAAGTLTLTQISGVNCHAAVSVVGANLVLSSVGNAGTGYQFEVRRSCNKSATGTTARPDICDYVYTLSGSTRTITIKTYTPGVGAISDAAFDFSSATGTFEIDVLF